MKWEKKKGIGNVLESYVLFHNEVNLCEIRMFKKGRYTLPENLFPRDNDGMLTTVKNLPNAKKKCEKWILDFSKSILNHELGR